MRLRQWSIPHRFRANFVISINKYDKIYAAYFLTKRNTRRDKMYAIGGKKEPVHRTYYSNTKINYLPCYIVRNNLVSEICRLTRTPGIIQQIRSSANREFNEYKFDLSDRAVKAFTRDASAERSLITGINLKLQLRFDRKKSLLGSINGGNGSLTTRGKSRRT